MSSSLSPKVLIAALTASALFATATARASFNEVYISASGTPTFQGGMVAGSLFTAITSKTYNSLGFIDLNATNVNLGPDGLLGSYEVGIWLVSSQTLLASATVTPSSPLIQVGSSFRYTHIAPVTIPAGESFIVGALLPDTPLDAWLTNAVNVDYVGITGPGSGRYLTGGTLSYPTQIGLSSYAIANASDAFVPEPATLSLMLLAAHALLRRRRPTRALA